MAKRKSRNSDAFDVDLTPHELEQLGDRLSTEIDDAMQARDSMIADGGIIDYLDWYYEQGRSAPQDRPFPGAADLQSYFIAENVDTMQAQLARAVMGVKPFCFVEGMGQSVTKAPFVEAFLDWQIPKTTLPEELDKTLQGALIEDCYVLEVRERIETRRMVETLDVALETSEDGGAIFGTDSKPKMRMDPATGDPVAAMVGEAAVKVERTYTKTRHLGPGFESISMKDFVFLPGHARNREQVWGYAYRFWDRIPTIEEKGEDGIYDADAITKLGENTDRDQEQAPKVVDTVASQEGPSVEKELFQVSLKRDLDGDGREEWYLATVSRKHRVLLRLKLDKFVMKVGMPRCVPFVLFPRRNAVYGYSYAEKLLTLAEEHTALRNMKADRGALATNAPIKVRQGALWNSDTQPFGVGRTIPVRDMAEVEAMQVPDVPNSVVEQERGLIQAKERVGMLSDSSVGVLADEKRTLGENRLAASGSGTRVGVIVGRLHRALRSVLVLTHAMFVEQLESDAKGLEAPQGVIDGLQGRGLELPGGRFTAEQLKGDFNFEPYGSVEGADPNRRRELFNASTQALGGIMGMFPVLQAVAMSPDAAKAILEEWLRVNEVRDRQPFLQALAMAAAAPPMPVAGQGGGPAPAGGPSNTLPPELMALLQQEGSGAGPV